METDNLFATFTRILLGVVRRDREEKTIAAIVPIEDLVLLKKLE